MEDKVIITAALAGSATFKNNNPATPYTPKEYADEAEKAFKARKDVLLEETARIVGDEVSLLAGSKRLAVGN